MTPRAVEEVQTIPHLLDRDGVFLRAVLQDQLFQVQEGTLVRDLLSDLYKRFPCVLGREFSAVRTLPVLYKVLDLEDLFQDCRGEDFLLDCHRDAQAFGMWFCPNEMRIGQPNFVQPFEFLETYRQQFLRFRAGNGPARGR